MTQQTALVKNPPPCACSTDVASKLVVLLLLTGKEKEERRGKPEQGWCHDDRRTLIQLTELLNWTTAQLAVHAANRITQTFRGTARTVLTLHHWILGEWQSVSLILKEREETEEDDQSQQLEHQEAGSTRIQFDIRVILWNNIMYLALVLRVY